MANGIRPTNLKPQEKPSLADKFVNVIGSWKFIVTQSLIMSIWALLNTFGPLKADPFPFILLNLLLSTQAALVGPIILMSSNRQGTIDRKRDVDHYLLDIEENETIKTMAQNVEKLVDKT